MEKIYNLIINIFFFILLLFLYISSVLYSYYVIDIDAIAKIFVIFGTIAFLVYLFYCICFKKNKIWNFIVIGIVLGLFISYNYAFDKRVALYGLHNGREGLLVILSYYSVFLLATTIKNNKQFDNLLKLLTILGVFNVFYGSLQILGIEYIFKIPVARNWSSSSGFLLNPDFMGSFMILLFSLWLPKYFLDDSKRIFNYVIFVIFIWGIIITGTMASFLTMIIVGLLFLVYLIIKRKEIMLKNIIIKLIIIITTSLLMYTFAVNFTNSNINNDVKNLNYEIKNTVTGRIEDSYGTGRIYIWKETLSYLPKYWLSGIGIDNFPYLGYEDGKFIYDSDKHDNVIYKAHNEFLQILITEGIFTFVMYIILLILIFVLSIKKLFIVAINKGIVMVSLVLSFSGYVIQSFFNFRIILVAPIFFMICGFLISVVCYFRNNECK